MGSGGPTTTSSGCARNWGWTPSQTGRHPTNTPQLAWRSRPPSLRYVSGKSSPRKTAVGYCLCVQALMEPDAQSIQEVPVIVATNPLQSSRCGQRKDGWAPLDLQDKPLLPAPLAQCAYTIFKPTPLAVHCQHPESYLLVFGWSGVVACHSC